ncbi:hypothetical protein pdam_00020679, partial [Pocillopora damicornis]
MSIYHSPQNSGYGQQTSSGSLPLIWKCLQSRGISQTTQDTILSSWWTASQKQVYLEKWQSFADRKAVDPLHPPEISLQNLTRKLAMLCALVRGQHCQTFHLMNLGQERRNPKTSHIFCIDQIVKQSTPSREQPILLRPKVVAD